MIKVISLTILMAFSALPVVADITAREVRDELVRLANDIDVDVEFGSEQFDNATLTLSDIVFQIDNPDPISSVEVQWIKITEISSDLVEITISPKNKIVFVGYVSAATEIFDIISDDLDGNESEPPEDLIVDHLISGFRAQISGDIDNYTLDFFADSEQFILPQSIVDLDVLISIDVRLEDIVGQIVVSDASADLFADFALSVDQTTVDITMEETENEFSALRAQFVSKDLRIMAQEDEKTELDEIASFEDIPNLNFDASIGESTLNMIFSGEGSSGQPETGDVDISLNGIHTAMHVSNARISGEAVLNEFSSTVDLDTDEVNDIFDITLDELGYRFGIKIDSDKGRANGFYRENTDNLVVSEEFWNLFDPDATIPRDPINSATNITGELVFNPDNLSVEGMERGASNILKSIHLSLNQYLFSGAGVRLEVTGESDFDFDGIDLVWGEPKMSASLHIDLDGALDLVTSLQALNFIPTDMAIGVRAIVGMVGHHEGDGDHFTSDITIDENGDLMVNGRPFEFPF